MSWLMYRYEGNKDRDFCNEPHNVSVVYYSVDQGQVPLFMPRYTLGQKSMLKYNIQDTCYNSTWQFIL